MKFGELENKVFQTAVDGFAEEFPEFWKIGVGPSAQAEKWNGRHAMFGLVVFLATGYAKSHGLIPDPDTLLSIDQWGPLSENGFGTQITNERAIILIAHVHVLMVSIVAAIAPFSFQDKLFLENGEVDAPLPGIIPDFKMGDPKSA